MRLQGKVSGFEQAAQLLRELPPHVENNILQGATQEAMRAVLPEMKAAAPRHLDKRSPASKKYGTLKQNIRFGRLKRVNRGEKGSRIHTGNAFWGFIYEKGSRHQPARPWFEPTFSRMEGTMIHTLGVAIARGIEQFAGRYRGGRK